MDRINYKGLTESVDIVAHPKYTDSINKWKNYSWDAYKNSTLIYHRDKTWQNCWMRFGMLEEDKAYTPSVLSAKYYNGIKYPPITNLKEYIERGGTLDYVLKNPNSNSDKTKIIEELYKIHSTIDWSVSNVYRGVWRTKNFLGNQWYTHAYDNKGNDLGARGWKDKWTFNFTNETQSIPYMFAGSNVSNISFRFTDNALMLNAQGMFKALQVPANVSIEDERGNKLVSTKTRGFAPYVMIEMFKQTGGQRIKDNGSWINWSNCHSADNFLQDNWVQDRIDSFNNEPLGNPSEGNTFIPNKPNETGTYPNFGRNATYFLYGSHALTYFGPLLNLKYLPPSNITNFFGPKLQQVRVINLNGGDWDFTQSKFDRESALYLLNNVYDRFAHWREYPEDNAESKRDILNETLTKDNPNTITYKIKVPESWREFITEDVIILLANRGWEVLINNEKLTMTGVPLVVSYNEEEADVEVKEIPFEINSDISRYTSDSIVLGEEGRFHRDTDEEFNITFKYPLSELGYFNSSSPYFSSGNIRAERISDTQLRITISPDGSLDNYDATGTVELVNNEESIFIDISFNKPQLSPRPSGFPDGDGGDEFDIP